MQAQHEPAHTYRQCVCSDACGKSKAAMLQQQLDERRHITTSKSTHDPEHRTFQSYKQFIISETPSKRLFHGLHTGDSATLGHCGGGSGMSNTAWGPARSPTTMAAAPSVNRRLKSAHNNNKHVMTCRKQSRSGDNTPPTLYRVNGTPCVHEIRPGAVIAPQRIRQQPPASLQCADATEPTATSQQRTHASAYAR